MEIKPLPGNGRSARPRDLDTAVVEPTRLANGDISLQKAGTRTSQNLVSQASSLYIPLDGLHHHQTTKAGEISFLPDELEFGDRLFKFLKGNVAMPLAVAVCGRKKRGKGNVAYACFANEAAVALFLKWDGCEIGGKTLVLEDVSLVSNNGMSQNAENLIMPAASKDSTAVLGP